MADKVYNKHIKILAVKKKRMEIAGYIRLVTPRYRYTLGWALTSELAVQPGGDPTQMTHCLYRPSDHPHSPRRHLLSAHFTDDSYLELGKSGVRVKHRKVHMIGYAIDGQEKWCK